MILVNDKQVDFTKFPDGTTSFRYNPFGSMTRVFNITWKYDGDEECILLWYLVNHIRDHDRNVRIRLLLPYIPNARMDRVKNADEVFTLKWFAQFINTLDFDDVLVDDPHSNVSAALLDRVKAYAEDADGKPIMIFKNPKTDTGHFKKSQRGCCRVVKTDDGYDYVDGLTWAEAQDSNELRTVFKDGKLEKQFTLDEVRKNLHGEAF